MNEQQSPSRSPVYDQDASQRLSEGATDLKDSSLNNVPPDLDRPVAASESLVGLSAPGHEYGQGDFAMGWRMGIADAWRAIEHLAVNGTADQGVRECRRRIEALGNRGPR